MSLPAPFDRLAEVLAGDPDAPDDVFTDDAEVIDRTSGETFSGIDEVREVWVEFAGRRAVATVEDVVEDGAKAAIRYSIRFRADAHQYAQLGTAWVEMDGGRIATWDVVWTEIEVDRSSWRGD